MNYIRTKDGIYEIIDETKYSYISIYGKYISKDDVIEDGDTIEELCDCLMFVDNDEEKDFLITEVNKDNLNYYDYKKETCYACLKIELPNGAIRIEPVAKFMYEKWEWELI